MKHLEKGTKYPDREEYILTGNETSRKGTKHPDREDYILAGENKSCSDLYITLLRLVTWASNTMLLTTFVMFLILLSTQKRLQMF